MSEKCKFWLAMTIIMMVVASFGVVLGYAMIVAASIHPWGGWMTLFVFLIAATVAIRKVNKLYKLE